MTSARRSPSTRPPTELRRLLVLCLAVTGVLAGSLSATALGAGDAAAAPPGSGHGLCFDLNSALARDSLTKIGRDVNGGSWEPRSASTNPLSRGCNLDWMLVTGNGIGDATYQSRVLLFHNGRFLGTVDPKPYSYTSIAGWTRDHVTVKYRWLRADDPFCCASGGPTYVTAFQFGGRVIRLGFFPPA
ncbi:MAG TPA: LppP/LprE family lipoprotein [Gordonia polyisoprenivorans]|uniref:LppP/LprE family lipoprotein n=1 Tax=Gordonia polyisoprenivorans TaxID=84595 RepID=A0A846WKE0_9ACTN|nr:LppP/LprE family lipoprotein [Gordonia polyisoprenivorans]NKY01587.1 LppP/LprE family lipoprotein [Gordonia polyisoprenivorans]UZF55520.1 LppP/LprE family lipoprotein [Gordonia polyisoprenivorans]GAB23098.1 hypothetical protein GOPIP_039_00450 [Gordonia polyisoprenivorans NBRC 16320 = JCM 10675]HCS58072.1 LppP/LprE family lipoprotein [Gordonia polyisoprenivorans]